MDIAADSVGKKIDIINRQLVEAKQRLEELESQNALLLKVLEAANKLMISNHEFGTCGLCMGKDLTCADETREINPRLPRK